MTAATKHVDLVQCCKTAIIKLDTKYCVLENECTKAQDREKMDNFLQKMSAMSSLLQADGDISLDLDKSHNDESGDDKQKNSAEDAQGSLSQCTSIQHC